MSTLSLEINKSTYHYGPIQVGFIKMCSILNRVIKLNESTLGNQHLKNFIK